MGSAAPCSLAELIQIEEGIGVFYVFFFLIAHIISMSRPPFFVQPQSSAPSLFGWLEFQLFVFGVRVTAKMHSPPQSRSLVPLRASCHSAPPSPVGRRQLNSAD